MKLRNNGGNRLESRTTDCNNSSFHFVFPCFFPFVFFFKTGKRRIDSFSLSFNHGLGYLHEFVYFFFFEKVRFFCRAHTSYFLVISPPPSCYKLRYVCMYVCVCSFKKKSRLYVTVAGNVSNCLYKKMNYRNWIEQFAKAAQNMIKLVRFLFFLCYRTSRARPRLFRGSR